MRVNNRRDWHRALDANDKQYGVAKLAICDQNLLLGYLQRHSHFLPDGIDEVFANVERYDRYDQLELVVRFYQSYPTYYVDHVVASGALEAPVALIGEYRTTKDILQRLKGAPPPANYAFAVGEPQDGNWSKAIAMLREKIGLSPEGGYTKEAAEKLYLYGRNHWRTGRGYLYSDNNPEVLFDAGYKEHVTVINSEVWVLAQLDINYLHDNEHETWTMLRTDPSRVMFDLSGRTTRKDYNRNIAATAWRVLMSYPNAVAQDVANDRRLGINNTLEVEDEFWLKKMFNQSQKVVWAAGAEVMYAMGKEFTWYTLMNSLSDNPQPVIVEEGVSYLFDDIIAKFKRNSYVRGEIDSFLADKTESFSRTPTDGLNLKLAHDYDLFAAMNKCSMWITGEKNEDGSWNLYIELTDTYDFTERLRVFEADSVEEGIGRAANNAAIISQDMGAIVTYPIEVRFTMKNYIPSEK